MNIHERSNRMLNYRKIAQIFLNEKFLKIFKSVNFKLSPESSKNPKNITFPWEWVIMTSEWIYPVKSELGTLKERVQNKELWIKFFQKSTFSWDFRCISPLGWILNKTPCHFMLFATIQYRVWYNGNPSKNPDIKTRLVVSFSLGGVIHFSPLCIMYYIHNINFSNTYRYIIIPVGI